MRDDMPNRIILSGCTDTPTVGLIIIGHTAASKTYPEHSWRLEAEAAAR
jgi:hypothetical protein